MYKVIVFIPKDHKENVKEAMFEAGAGKIGNYSHCSFETLGHGQFKPGAESDPFLGEKGKIEIVEEFRVEMVVSDEKISRVIKAMKESHPYEEVAYDVFKHASI